MDLIWNMICNGINTLLIGIYLSSFLPFWISMKRISKFRIFQNTFFFSIKKKSVTRLPRFRISKFRIFQSTFFFFSFSRKDDSMKIPERQIFIIVISVFCIKKIINDTLLKIQKFRNLKVAFPIFRTVFQRYCVSISSIKKQILSIEIDPRYFREK